MGWLAKEVERTIASWLNANSVDNALNRPDFSLAEDAMRWKRSTLDGDQLTVMLSLQELCDKIEGEDEHQVIVTHRDGWKMTHPLSCRMAGLVHCTMMVDDDLYEGTWAWRDETWVEVPTSL